MAKVCLIYPRDINLNFFPLGVGYIAAYLRQHKHEVFLLDLAEEDIDVLDDPKVLSSDIIGISLTTTQLKVATKIVDRIKSLNSSIPIAAGGIHPSYFKEKFFEQFYVDYVIYGEGEVTFGELCDELDKTSPDFSRVKGLIYRDNNEIIKNPKRDLIDNLDDLPFPARDLVNYETYLQPPGLIRGVWTNRSANITTSRGCPGKCTYCGVNYLCDKYRRRSVENVIAEIDTLVETYDIDGLYFMDDTFLMNKKWIIAFTDRLKEKNYKFKWSCYGRVDTIDDDIIKAIRSAGCTQVEFGIESGSEDVLLRIKKGVTTDKIKQAISMTKKHGVRVLGSFIMGFAEDEEKDLQDTIDLAYELDMDFCTCYYATPYPGSEIYEDAIAEGRILEPDMSKWYVRNNNIWKINLDPQTLFLYRQKFFKKIKYNNLLFFFKRPVFFVKLVLFIIANYNAIILAIYDSLKARNFNDLGYYFYVHLSKGMKSRNKI